MGKVIQIDFRQNREKEVSAFRAFEEAMMRQAQIQKFKTAGLMIILSVSIISAMAVPLALHYFSK